MSRLFGWLLNFCYAAVILLASPVIAWRALRHGKYRNGWAAKLLGRVPVRRGDAPCVWLHAVSVGEVNLLATTIAELQRQRPGCEIVVSTTTKTGFDLARKKYAELTVFYCPLDFTWACAGAVNRLRPSLLVLAELELWPNLIAAAKRGGAKVAIINGRLSDNSFRGYRRLRRLAAPVLRQLDLIAAQDDETATRFRELGAEATAVRTTGSLKFDGAESNRNNPRTTELKRLAGISGDDQIFLAGSTQAPEEQYALDALRRRLAAEADSSWEGEAPAEPNPENAAGSAGASPSRGAAPGRQRATGGRLRLIIVPRHAERFEEVANLIAASGLPWIRRSQLADEAAPVDNSLRELPPILGENRPRSAEACATAEHKQPWRVLLVDAIGELGAWWGAADVGFVGGSFGSRGGQNMLEPAAYGVPTCFGPNTRNFRDIVRRLLAVQGAVVVADEAELDEFVNRALDDATWAADLGDRARLLVASQQGATRRTVDLLARFIPQPPASAQGDQAA